MFLSYTIDQSYCHIRLQNFDFQVLKLEPHLLFGEKFWQHLLKFQFIVYSENLNYY